MEHRSLNVVEYIGKCECPCHNPIKHPFIVHPVPCCETGPHFKKDVARGMQEEHEEHCKKKARSNKAL